MLHSKIFAGTIAVGLLAAASPASSQSGPDRRSRTDRVTDEIVRGIEDTADAVVRVTDAVDRSAYGYRYGAEERFAVDRCRARVERYGRARIEHVGRYGRRSWRVDGVTDGRQSYGRYNVRGSGPRAFTCTVRYDGRVRVKTRRLRYRYH